MKKVKQITSSLSSPGMTFDSSHRECWLQRWHKDVFFWSLLRSFLFVTCLVLVLMVSLYPGLWSIGVRLHSIFTGNYLPGHHSILFIYSPTEQTARDIGRAIIEKRLAASINILTRTSTMSVHPYAAPQVLSIPVEDGSPEYLNWMDEVIPQN
ncbi:protein CutA homolog [Eucyclogobius newberryi]|uniref:protein CutA homolog n=1 Tax=Eucyclogobius newberryi TaxID=166745 RepID=UPI003B5C3246